MYVVSENAAKKYVTAKDAIVAVEAAFAALERGEAEVFPVAAGTGSDKASGFAIKSGLIRSGRLLGLKVGTYWPQNRDHDLESHGSTTLLLDDDTGFPQALVSASYLTALRTAAADAVAVKYLARDDASSLAIVGAGHQAWYDLQPIREVRPIERVHVWSRTPAHAEAFAARARDEGLAAEALPLDDALAVDIVVSTTAAQEALVVSSSIRPGTHLSAMGADSVGKQELDVELVARSKLFADTVNQAVSIGEYQSAVKAGCITEADITTLGAVINGQAKGRAHPDDITIFDSSGLAIQDLAIADVALTAARQAGAGQELDLS